MVDGDEVAAGGRDLGEQRGQAAGTVGDAREEPQAPSGRGLVAAGDRGQQPGVDVAAGEHDDGGALARRPDDALQQRGDADRAGALDDELGPLQQPHDRLGDLLVADHAQLVDESLDQRAGDWLPAA